MGTLLRMSSILAQQDAGGEAALCFLGSFTLYSPWLDN